MNKYFLLLLMLVFPIYGWSCSSGANYGDVTMANLPEQILINAGSYSAGTVLYDSGRITRSNTQVWNCEGKMYARFEWSSANAGALTGDHIYTTSVPGIGLRVKVWLNITGEYDGDTDDFLPDYTEHYIGDSEFYLGRPGGFLDIYATTNYSPAYQLQLVATGGAIASNSSLSIKDPISSVSLKDSTGTMVISQLHISGTTQIKLTPMGCTAGTTALNFPMGSVKTSEFTLSSIAGSAQQTLMLSCEPGTNISMRVTATEAEGDNPNRSVIALTAGENVATGVGVQLSLNGKVIPLNTSFYLSTSSRSVTLNAGAEASYATFTYPNNPGGAAASNSLIFSTNYYKTGAEVTPGTANASGTITFTYN
ncbi:TPA: type 1 fimbrial protein [Klebsiella oxytoca]|uniref:type 1 fimbrial protein n=1 Tax=Klebsiella oxytoca TaxID=571 RepID=UPI001158B1E1|nr:type 1 fimbrial protein [Klebsiella oxytoca]EKH6435695.1 type 1 fimbrial protein [Klebsiella oxytoca]EKJ7588166.1 type 1 fimbrial protein [Klebsiella oxytoca]MBZ7635964.1 type 1 fimbrial protein [Klebsiella oxytoca]MDG9996215.1 type 1 fimbrial protein [Klebsiella oxytoca]MDU4362250.1 type 1 fimbrial protein [Klebsiella oxytoca]